MGGDKYLFKVNPLSANLIKWSSTLKQFVDKKQVCLTILWSWGLKG